jgi:hypothetical protein
MREIKAMRVTDQILQHGSTLAFYFFSLFLNVNYTVALYKRSTA